MHGARQRACWIPCMGSNRSGIAVNESKENLCRYNIMCVKFAYEHLARGERQVFKIAR